MAVIVPSILSADFTRLGEELVSLQVAGTDWIHVDVMDGHFVPNLTMGPMIVEAVRRVTSLPIDVHLMIDNPDQFIETFATAGVDAYVVGSGIFRAGEYADIIAQMRREIERGEAVAARAR